jgi:hypothetical protein
LSVKGHEIAAMILAFGLAASLPLGRQLLRWSHRGLHLVESFSAGVSLSYVMADLMVELMHSGAEHVHAALPIGPTHEKTIFSIVLIGATWWYIVAALSSRVRRPRVRYRVYIVPQAIYAVLVGCALAFESEQGAQQLVLFALAMLLHLTVVESHIHHDFKAEHTGLRPILLAIAPGVGAAAWVLLTLSPAVLFIALALVAGSTVVQIVQTELPSPSVVRIGPFLFGVCLYSLMIAARWVGI